MAKLRTSESLVVSYFIYAACLAFSLPIQDSKRLAILLATLIVVGLYSAVSYFVSRRQPLWLSYVRDWLPVALAFLAYRQSGWYVPSVAKPLFDPRFMHSDRWLYAQGFQSWIEAIPLLPPLLELSYLLVYAVAPAGIVTLYLRKRRVLTDIYLSYYLLGLLLSYGMFAFFPSTPPRSAYPAEFLPHMSWLRQLNLSIVGNLGIYTSVFPSAHVSGAVASALGLVKCLGIRDHAAQVALVYALLVSLATVYGRYHYAVDAVAGIAVGLGAAAMATAALRWGDRLSPEIAALRRTLSQ